MRFIFKTILILSLLAAGASELDAQSKQYRVSCIGFYNLENLFDTIDTPDVRDTEFTPEGDKVWTSKKYYKKLNNMADVIAEVGSEHIEGGPFVLGVSEIENRAVLEDLVQMPQLKNSGYDIVHYNSPDRRGVDVALLYRKEFFTVTNSRSARLVLPKGTDASSKGYDDFKTRDQLVVSGLMDGEEIHFIVNHWPSRRGGEKRSRPLRNAAAGLTKSIADSIFETDENAKIIIMGDLNDQPTNESVKKILGAKPKAKKVKPKGFYNPMYKKYKKGIGTGAYRDSWSLFDQLLPSYALLGDDRSTYKVWKTLIFKKPYLLQKSGRFEGYPFRTFVGDTFMGGYSDHFPVYMFLIKEK